MNDTRIVEVLLREVPDLLLAYRFGSTVTGDTHSESDLDIAVLSSRPIPTGRLFEVSGRLEQEGGIRVDLVDLLEAPTVLRMQVVSTGRVIAVRDEAARATFENRTFSQYARLNEERRAIVAQVLRDKSVHGG